MDKSAFKQYSIEDRSYLSFIKREIHNLIAQAGFESMRAGEIDIIVSELCSNLIKHANGGELIYRLLPMEDGNKVFEIYCIDNGPGTNDIKRYMKDGISSANTLGHGLGSIRRLSDFFQIYSIEEWGTVVYSKVELKPKTVYRKENKIDFKMIQTCFPGEQLCGDGYFVKELENETRIFVGDGLGHGIYAHEAIESAIEAFKNCEESDPVAILRTIHQQVRKTRGLVATVATLNHEQKKWKICGIGNINTRLYQGLQYRNYMAHNGIVGLNIPNTLKAFETAQEELQWVIFFSDGIKSRWDLSRYPSILKYDAAIIAAAIFKDNARRNDDMTILVGKINR